MLREKEKAKEIQPNIMALPPILPVTAQAAKELHKDYNSDHDKSMMWTEVMIDDDVDVCLGQSTLSTFMKSSVSMNIIRSNECTMNEKERKTV